VIMMIDDTGVVLTTHSKFGERTSERMHSLRTTEPVVSCRRCRTAWKRAAFLEARAANALAAWATALRGVQQMCASRFGRRGSTYDHDAFVAAGQAASRNDRKNRESNDRRTLRPCAQRQVRSEYRYPADAIGVSRGQSPGNRAESAQFGLDIETGGRTALANDHSEGGRMPFAAGSMRLAVIDADSYTVRRRTARRTVRNHSSRARETQQCFLEKKYV
jgi:hypothetical protein